MHLFLKFKALVKVHTHTKTTAPPNAPDMNKLTVYSFPVNYRRIYKNVFTQCYVKPLVPNEDYRLCPNERNTENKFNTKAAQCPPTKSKPTHYHYSNKYTSTTITMEIQTGKEVQPSTTELEEK